MGMYDDVRVGAGQFRCSEGHDLTLEGFQTKDLGCTMGRATIDRDGMFAMTVGDYGQSIARPFSGTIEIYSSCRECPAFVQARTLNLLDREVAFDVRIASDRVEQVTRRGGSLTEWLEERPEWMAGCARPMPYAHAYEIHCRRAPFPQAK